MSHIDTVPACVGHGQTDGRINYKLS